MNDLETSLRSTLTGGTALTALLAGTASVYNAVMPRSASFPCVVYQQQSGVEPNDNPHRTMNYLYTVKALSDTSMSQAGAIDAQLDALLDGGTALTALLAGTASVYNAVMPRTAAFPCVVFNQQAGTEPNDNPHRTMTYLYTVQALSDVGMTQAGAIDTQLDALLDGSTALTATGYTTIWAARESMVRYVETTPEGEYRYHSGGVYRIRLAS